MNIKGLQKLTLLDYPGKVACTVFSGGCNFRCPFCHNAMLVTADDIYEASINEDDFFSFLKKRQGILDGVCLTGGEPLMDPDVYNFMKKIKSLSYSLKLDTNGSFPERLKEAIGEGLVDYVAMDIKASPEKYHIAVGKENYDISKVEKSVDILLNGSVPYEFRTTLVNGIHEPTDFEKIGQFIKGAQSYYLQKFVDSGNLISPGMTGIEIEIAKKCLETVRSYVFNVSLRGYE